MAEIRIRSVYDYNVEEEFQLIDSILYDYPIISFDTEFPGMVFEPQQGYHHESPSTEKYTSMKKNVDATKIIQLGLCLSDARGNLPHFGSNYRFIWEFNFGDFDVDVDAHNPSSIQLLKNQGIDFQKNKKEGINVGHFAQLFLASGLGGSIRALFGRGVQLPKITWVLFHSTYDLGYLIKILAHRDLPDDQLTFITLVYAYLGFSIFDVKEIASALGLHGGLEKVSQHLGVSRQAGKSHQAGSDSLLTMHAFLSLRDKYFFGQNTNMLGQFSHKLHGLEADPSDVRQGLAKMRMRVVKPSGAENNRVEPFQNFARHHPAVPFRCYPVARIHPVAGGYPVIRRFRMLPMGAIAPVTLY